MRLFTADTEEHFRDYRFFVTEKRSLISISVRTWCTIPPGVDFGFGFGFGDFFNIHCMIWRTSFGVAIWTDQ